MEFYFNHLKCEAVLNVLMWNDCQDIVLIHEKKKNKARKVCLVHYHFYFSLPQIFINIYMCIYMYTHTQIYIHTQNVSGRIHKKQVSVVASGKKN